ncbi:T9SS C-terminal target domain-containing protein, partial [candidate division KSB1 bacterium]
ADGEAGLQIVNVSNPQNPTWVGSYATPGAAWDVFVSDSYAYVADGEVGLQIVNVSDPQNPTLAASYDTPGSAHGVHVIGNNIYLADEYSFMVLSFNPLGVDKPVVGPPRIFSLAQNYPNPFNATTTLTYALDKTGPVELSIFNSLGQRAAVLLSGAQAAGEHRAIWDAAGFPSGAYYARLKSADQTRTTRMILLK